MLCERCKKNEANYYYRENVNGVEKTFHLCGDCVKELEKAGEIKGFSKESLYDGFLGGNDLNALFASLFAPSAKRGQGAKAIPERTKCSLCGAVFDDLVREGKAGCPKCYEIFSDEFEESIRRIHGRSSHTGREPAKFREKNEAKRKITTLEGELKEAIAAENYERAAELRDEIKALRAAETASETDNGIN